MIDWENKYSEYGPYARHMVLTLGRSLAEVDAAVARQRAFAPICVMRRGSFEARVDVGALSKVQASKLFKHVIGGRNAA